MSTSGPPTRARRPAEAMLSVTLKVPGHRNFEFSATALCMPVGGADLLIEPGADELRATLAVGALTVHVGPRQWVAAVHGGNVRVREDSVEIEATAIEFADRINVRRAHAAQGDAADRLRSHNADDVAAAALRRANLRLAVAARIHPAATDPPAELATAAPNRPAASKPS